MNISNVPVLCCMLGMVMNFTIIMVPYDIYKGWGESYPVLVAHPAKTGYVNEGFLVEIPEWGGICQLKKNEAFQERD